jgi:prepilin-type N-terminal cleavage/methylation domain-containing protein
MGRKYQKLHGFHSHFRKLGSGFSLVELMVALAIAGFLGIGMWALMTTQNSTYAAQDNASQMQQCLRAAIDKISRDLLSAGQPPPWQMTMNGQSTVSWYVPTTPYGVGVANRLDIIGCPGTTVATLSVQVASGATQITLSAGQGASFPVGTYIDIGDTTAFESAKVKAVAGDTLTIDTNPNTNKALQNGYAQGAQVWPIQWTTYIVANNQLTRDVHDGTVPTPVVATNITGLAVGVEGGSLQITLTGSSGGITSSAVDTIHLRNQ